MRLLLKRNTGSHVRTWVFITLKMLKLPQDRHWLTVDGRIKNKKRIVYKQYLNKWYFVVTKCYHKENCCATVVSNLKRNELQQIMLIPIPNTKQVRVQARAVILKLTLVSQGIVSCSCNVKGVIILPTRAAIDPSPTAVLLQWTHNTYSLCESSF